MPLADGRAVALGGGEPVAASGSDGVGCCAVSVGASCEAVPEMLTTGEREGEARALPVPSCQRGPEAEGGALGVCASGVAVGAPCVLLLCRAGEVLGRGDSVAGRSVLLSPREAVASGEGVGKGVEEDVAPPPAAAREGVGKTDGVPVALEGAEPEAWGDCEGEGLGRRDADGCMEALALPPEADGSAVGAALADAHSEALLVAVPRPALADALLETRADPEDCSVPVPSPAEAVGTSEKDPVPLNCVLGVAAGEREGAPLAVALRDAGKTEAVGEGQTDAEAFAADADAGRLTVASPERVPRADTEALGVADAETCPVAVTEGLAEGVGLSERTAEAVCAEEADALPVEDKEASSDSEAEPESVPRSADELPEPLALGGRLPALVAVCEALADAEPEPSSAEGEGAGVEDVWPGEAVAPAAGLALPAPPWLPEGHSESVACTVAEVPPLSVAVEESVKVALGGVEAVRAGEAVCDVRALGLCAGLTEPDALAAPVGVLWALAVGAN